MEDENKICSIIIPTYNEADNIKEMITSLSNLSLKIPQLSMELIIVDDGSTDGTISIINNTIGISKMPIFLIQREKKLGIGSAYREAFKHVKGDLIAIMDADFSHNPADLLRMIQEQSNDPNLIIWSTRYSKNGKIENWSWIRQFISHSANFLARFILNIPVSDVTSAFRVYRKPIFQKIISDTKTKGFSFQMEAAFLAKKYHSKNVEVPVVFHDRKVGKSKFSIFEILEFILTLIRLFFISLFYIYK